MEACLQFLEAAYQWDVFEEQWLERLVSAFARVWGTPRWGCAFTYDASDVERFRFSAPITIGGSRLLREFLVKGLSSLTPEMLARSFLSTAVGFARPLGVIDEKSSSRLTRLDTSDHFGINGRDASRRGCFLGLGADRTELTGDEVILFQRLSAHLASAYRLRRILEERGERAIDEWEAMADVDGTVLESRGPADSSRERDSIALAVRSRESARRRGAKKMPTTEWRPRVSSRWTLIDVFSRAGRRYVVARENHAPSPGLDALTEREQQIVASAATGQSTKEIAYELGISHGTVRVLLARACGRLGVSSKKELLDLHLIRALRGGVSVSPSQS
jgi:DNA-binding CsgD family transcriptional regulator